VTGPVVTAIFSWRASEQLGYQAIVDRLNADLARYPAPISPDPARTRTDWTRSSIQSLLTNPKYTGYMVWNRRATKKRGKVNAPSEWVWSPQPTHEPLVTRELFDAAQRAGGERRGSRSANTINRHPATKRSYLLRSYVFCEMCGRRMFGKTLRGRTYYACQPGLNLGQAAADRHPDHPGSIWVREDGLLDGLHQLLDERVFGPDRRELLAAELGHETTQRRDDHAARRAALERAIAQIGERQDRLIATLETRDDATGALFDRVRDRMDTLERERTAKVAALRELDQAADPASDPGLLDALPTTTIDWNEVPAEFQRDLFDALQVHIRYDRTTNTAHGQVTLVGDTGTRVPDAIRAENKEPGPTDRADRSIVVRAPGRIRTCDARLRKPPLYPLSYEGGDVVGRWT
jgi:site-specific DNA recombinase